MPSEVLNRASAQTLMAVAPGKIVMLPVADTTVCAAADRRADFLTVTRLTETPWPRRLIGGRGRKPESKDWSIGCSSTSTARPRIAS